MNKRDEAIAIRYHRTLNHFFGVETLPGIGDIQHRFRGKDENNDDHKTMRSGTTRALLRSLTVMSKGVSRTDWLPYTNQVVSIPYGPERGSVSVVVYNDHVGVMYKGKKRVRDGAYAKFTKNLKRNPGIVLWFHCRYVVRLSERSTSHALVEMGKGVEFLVKDCKYNEVTRELVIPTKYHDNMDMASGYADVFGNLGITTEMLDNKIAHMGSGSSDSSSVDSETSGDGHGGRTDDFLAEEGEGGSEGREDNEDNGGVGL